MGWTAPYTAGDIINEMLMNLGIIGASETPSAADSMKCLRAINFMLDNWSGRKLLLQAQTRLNFPLVANQQAYTIGSGGNFNTTKPYEITSAFYRDQNKIDKVLDLFTREQFDSFEDKAIVSAPMDGLFYDPGPAQQATQMGTIYLYFTPDASSSYTLWMEAYVMLTEFASLTAAYTFMPVYLEAIVFNGMKRIAGTYGRALTQEQKEIAMESLQTIEALNSQTLIAESDIPMNKGAGFNWISGEPN